MSLHRKSVPDPGPLTTEIVSEIDRDKHILLYMLDLHREKVAPLDLTTMLYEITPSTEDHFPQDPTELSNAFLRRLWLSNPQARSTCCKVAVGEYGLDMDEDSQCAINPLDLVAVIYMTTNSFLQQEITHRMLNLNFAVPLYLPPIHPEKKGTILLSPFRGVLGEWKSPSEGTIMKNMANSRMPLLTAVRLGRCNVSKSRVLNRVLGGPNKLKESFINGGMDGGQLPRVLSDGLVEVCWNLSSGDHHENILHRPVLVANLRGDAANFEKQMSLLCYASALLIVFCENFGAKEQELLASWRDNSSHIILIDCSTSVDDGQDGQENQEKMKQRLVKDLELSEETVLNGCDVNEEEIANCLRDVLNRFIPHLHTANLVGTAGMANDLDINVDEDEVCRMAFSEVEKVLSGIEHGVSSYFENQLPLQGTVWKQLCQLEKDEARHPQHRTQSLIGEKENLLKQLLDYKLTTAMRVFIDALCSFDTNKRAFFLSWMRVKLEVLQLDKLSLLRGANEEQMQEPCIGLEHFLREMGLIYERYFRGPNSDLYDMFRLPYVGAELLLYGVPLELYDGDASVFPMNWVYSVLYEVHRQLPKISRMRVLTILGFHSSKNAEILSALFGVNFPKGGRRHIKGAYMLLLTLPDNFRMEMDCEFLMVIGTEGLNCQAEQNFVHDCELATFVSGLSDITLVNLPDEGQDETRRNLQIAVNALLFTQNWERKTTFHVASEGAGMDGQIMKYVTDVLSTGQRPNVSQRETLLTNETEGISCDLSSPWTSNSVTSQNDQICSDAILRLKKSLLTMFHEKSTNGQPTCLGAFMEHMCNLWEKVKKENFAMKFGDTSTADAIIGLCTKIVKGEKKLSDQLDLWVQGLDNHITDLSASQNEENVDSNAILEILTNEAVTQINTESDHIKASLWDYLRQEDIDISLVENYKASLLKRVDLLQEHMTTDVGEKLETATARHKMTAKMKALLTSLEAALEVKLRSLLQASKNNDCVIEDEELKREFVGVWEDIPSKLKNPPLDTQEIFASMLEQLKVNLSHNGLKKQNIRLWNANQLNGFKVKTVHFALSSKMRKSLKYNKNVAQRYTNGLIEDCDRKVSEKLVHKEGYSDSYIRELLATVDTGLEVLKCKNFTLSPKFEVDIKGYICSKTAESFQEQQELLIREREAKVRFLNETKDRHMMNFIYQFRKRDQCQKAAQFFTNMCLKPAAEDFIYTSLEKQIFNGMLQKENAQLYTSPKKFHFSLLKEMLLNDSFENYHEYLQSHESFSRKRIENFIRAHLSGSVMIEDRREQRMQKIFTWVKRCIIQASESSNRAQCSVRLLLEKVCKNLKNLEEITLPTQILEQSLFDISTHPENFLANLQESVNELNSSIAQEFMENEEVIEVPDNLPYKLQDMLYERVKGCDKRCPFCKAPCDLEEKEHQVHEAVVHRPKGLVCYTNANSTTLSHNTCSADITGQNQFQNKDTEGQSLPFKDYQSIYPDWKIYPEDPRNTGVAVYWRYVFTRYNNRFAQEYQCAPAILPEAWGKITQNEALQSLREAFHITE